MGHKQRKCPAVHIISIISAILRRGPGSASRGSSGPDLMMPEEVTDADVDDGSESAKFSKETKQKPLNVRKEFPETWLWTEEVVK